MLDKIKYGVITFVVMVLGLSFIGIIALVGLVFLWHYLGLDRGGW